MVILFLLNSVGRFVYHLNNDLILKDSVLQNKEQGVAELAKHMLAGEIGQAFYTNKGQRMWAAYAPVKEYMQAANRRLHNMIIILSIALLVLLTIAYFLANSNVQPITQLRGVMKRVESGSLEETITSVHKDEIGDLYDSFNAMLEGQATAQAQKLAILQAIPDLIFRIDINGTFLDFNQPEKVDLFVPPEQFLGKNIADIFPLEVAKMALNLIQQSIEKKTVELFEYHLSVNDQIEYFEARFVKCGEFEVLAIVRDITYRKNMEQKLEFLSLHDSLTKVFNRAYFEERVLHIPLPADASAGIIVCDVDGLKLINDTLGHVQGDSLIKITANILKSCISFSDVIARIGGDEFVIIVSNPEMQTMDELSIKIKEAIENYNRLLPQIPLSLSIGWAISFGNKDMNVLYKEADNNMYQEKMHHHLNTHSMLVNAMIQALEARDFIAEGHADRLAVLVEGFGQKWQLSDPLMSDLKLLAKFHDVGKVGIPDNILFKVGKLTEEESMIMQCHCDIGYRIAKADPKLAPIAEWILKHQEWWNGQGYPLGLSGEDIPLPCRMIAIVDAFDAMTHDRPYRKALTYQEAIGELRRCAGIQFDPVLTNDFIERLTNEGEILKNMMSVQGDASLPSSSSVIRAN